MANVPDQVRHDIDEWTRPPFLRRVRIQGYKSIAVCDVTLQPLTILVGRNGAGKSNFLDALAFLRDMMDTSVSEAGKRRGGWSSIFCRTVPLPKIVFEIEAGFTCGPPYQRIFRNGHPPGVSPPDAIPDLQGHSFVANYRVELTNNQHSLPTIARESLEIVDEATGSMAGFEVDSGIITRFRSKLDSPPLPIAHSQELQAISRLDHLLLGFIGIQPFIDLADGLRFMGFYNFHPEAIRSARKPLLGMMLEKDGSNLASVIESLDEIDPDSLERVQAYLSIINEDVEHFDVARHGEYQTIQFRLRSALPTRLVFDASSMSDGTLRALAALMAAFQIHLPTGPTVIGIEEPETALHPAAMRVLVDAMDEATQRTQVLLTTHSADLLSGREVTPGLVLVVRSRNGQTHITPVDSASRAIIQQELYSLADLQRMDRLDLDEADLQRQVHLGNGSEGR
jgi:predicted ATPase